MASLSDDLYLCRYVDPGGNEQCFFKFTGEKVPENTAERLARLNKIEAAYLAAEAAEDMGMPTAVQDLQKLKVILTVKQGIEDNGKL